jgi:hypothetical protein
MPVANKNCFRSQGGTVIELTSSVPEPDILFTQHRLAGCDNSKPARSKTSAHNPVRNAINQYYFYD